MSGWELGLVLAIVLVVGWLGGIVSTFLYGRRLMRRQLDQLPQQLLDVSSTGRPVEPPPPRTLPTIEVDEYIEHWGKPDEEQRS